MKATGIIVEYNPFHNGHLYHASRAREESGADIVVAVMSGQFLQRGEPAFVDKWTRTKMALASGVDIVIELPYIYATAQASEFAKGSIFLLDALCCESFCFGSEQGNIEPFLHSRKLLVENREKYQQLIHDAVQAGISYPKALNEAYTALSRTSDGFADLSKPNNILGYHYIEAAENIQSSIRPQTIQRVGANYHDSIEDEMTIASATGIRKAFFENGSMENLQKFMPEATLDALKQFKEDYQTFGSWQQFYPLLQYAILRDRPQSLSKYAEVTEGIENLIYEAAKKENNFESFISQVKSKRFTRTRLQRMVTHIYTGFTWQQLQSFESPTYLRLLGMTKNGRQYLNYQKKNIKLPVISRAAELTDEMGKLDIHASNMYLMGMGSQEFKKEFTTPPLYFG